ncbi:MAG: menaquinone biosynthesis decarboxylase [Bacteroidetes bacterium]|nr:menaquinone biosynthesis decarboxylase [Bacteroidota bacterium]
MFDNLQDFIKHLEKNGELQRIKVEVDPVLEVSEIAVRALKQDKPALLFENVKGSQFPLVVNHLASSRRIELALGKHPDEIGEELIRFVDKVFPPTPKVLFQESAMVKRFYNARPKQVMLARSQAVIKSPNLNDLPILKTWPHDGGKFITLPQVVTYDPISGKRNIGMYRMHVFNETTTGMHWQIQKGGGFHYYNAEKLGKPLEVAVAIGTDPALLLATIAALPEGIDEAMFAGFLRNKPTEFTSGRTINISVPANAEFILEGIVEPRKRKMEGPFGDHFGHYSNAAEFPLFNIQTITHRKDPIFPATVVGIPPMEDKFLGDATQQILAPLSKLIHHEIKSLWAYYEAGFHNLLVVSIEERYAKEAMKTALGLMGTGQLALTKCLICVSETVDVRNFNEVLKAVQENFDPHFDFVMIPKVPLDTLDFTSYKMNLGSKMILDATKKRGQKEKRTPVKKLQEKVKDLSRLDRRIIDARLVEGTLLLVKVKSDGSAVIKKLLKNPELQEIKIAAAVSFDVDINDQESYIWGVFTRFDCERDINFTEQKLIGISPVYNGMMGIDATWKTGYPDPLSMPEEIIKKVNERWESYWR